MNRLDNMERKQRIKELLKRKIPEKECRAVHPKEKENTTHKNNTIKETTDTNINDTNNEKIVGQGQNVLIRKNMSTNNTNINLKQNKTITTVCIVCGKNLSRLSLDTREIHINACLDDKIESETNSTSLKKSGTKQWENKQQHSLFAIAMVCPCCNITFKAKTEKGKLNHFKMCGKKHKYSPTKMLEFLQELKRKYGRDSPNSYLSSAAPSSVLSKPETTSLCIRPKEKKLTEYFNSISNDRNKRSKMDLIPKENPKLSYVVSRSYNVSVIDDNDDDFQSSIVFKAISTVEKSDKRKKEIND